MTARPAREAAAGRTARRVREALRARVAEGLRGGVFP